MNVLSLFDGSSCGQNALERAGIKVDNYFASEVEEDPIFIARKNHPNTVHLGDVTKWREWNLPKIDLLIGGSPCQGFSRQGIQLNFDDPRSKLFFEYVDILHALREANPNIKFLLENVDMRTEWQNIISKYLEIVPIKINSRLLSAQNRQRTYWSNIEGVIKPVDKKINLASLLEDVDTFDFKDIQGIKVDPTISEKSMSLISVVNGETRIKQSVSKGYIVAEEGDGINLSFPTSKSRRGRVIKSKSSTIDTACNICVYYKGAIRRFTISEMEKLQTLPVGYTEGIKDRARMKVLGNGWTVDVIAHIFKGLKEVTEMTNKDFPQVDLFNTEIRYNDAYYVLPDGTIVDAINVDEYFVQVLKAQMVRKGEE